MAIVLNNTLDCAPEVRQPTAATHDTALKFEQYYFIKVCLT